MALIDAGPRDRILLLGLPAAEEVVALARVISEGIIVGMAAPDQVYETRRAVADFENVMCLIDDDGPIPWQSEFFSIVASFQAMSAARETEARRVLTPAGRLLSLQAS